MDDALRDRLWRLETRVAVEERIARYCFAIDLRDRAALLDCFTEDVKFRRSDGSFDRGRERLWDYFVAALGDMGPTWHLPFNNLVVEFEGPDRVSSRHYGYAEHALEDRLVVAAMTYRHELRAEGGTWRISRRVVDFWYFCDADELVRRYGSRSALWWRGTPPRQWPEAAATYRDFAAAHRGLAGTDPA
jgi:hypothetical protein